MTRSNEHPIAAKSNAGKRCIKRRHKRGSGSLAKLRLAFESLEDRRVLAVSTPDLDPASDTGVSNTDDITNLTVLDFTGTADAGDTVELWLGGATPTMLATTTATAGGTYSFDDVTVPAGTQQVFAVASDGVNPDETSGNLDLVVDTTAPAVSVPDLDAASDSGASNSDNITNATSPVFTGTAEAGSTVQLLVDGTLAGTAVTADANGDWSITLTGLAEGTRQIAARATDTAGNETTSGDLTIEVDTTAPAVSAPDLDAASDTGTSDTDNITSQTTLDFTGTAEANSTVELWLDGATPTMLDSVTATAGGTYSFDDVVLAEGTHQLFTVARDLAGNETTSGTLTVEVDTTDPAVSVPELEATSDNGSSDTDDITNAASPVFTGTAEAGSTVQLLVDGVATGSPVVADTSGDWSITLTGLAEGTRQIAARATDTAGNETTSGDLTIEIDTTDPAVSVPDLEAASDTGASSTDNITSASSLTFTGTAEVGSTVQLLVDGTLAGTAVTADANGDWSITLSGLADGTRQIAARATDTAGNENTSAELEVVVDTTDPGVSAPDLAAGSDSGSSSTDNITNQTTVDFTGTAEAGSTVELWLAGTTPTMLDSTTATAGGTYSFDDVVLAAGTNQVFTIARDAAGNEATSTNLNVTVDTTAPTVSTPDLAAGSDTGTSNSDNLTNAPSPVFTGTAEAGATVQLLVDGTPTGSSATADASGNWSITLSGLANGTRQIAARATDAAGNQTTSAALSVTIDTAAPTVSPPDLAAGSDSGTSNTDNITNANSLVFTGTATAGATVQLLVGGTATGTAVTADASGNWTVTLVNVTEGVREIKARATDAAGNATDSTALNVTVDRTLPTTGLTPASGSITEATQVSWNAVDTLAGIQSTVVTLDGTQISTSNSGSRTLGVGTHTVIVTATDRAGNVTTDTRNYTVTAATGARKVGSELVIDGTAGNDRITVTRLSGGRLNVNLNGQNSAFDAPFSRIVIRGGAGDDRIAVGKLIKNTAYLEGGAGNDIIHGGGGADILVGGEGNDRLMGRKGRDVIFGGLGADTLRGSDAEDLLMGDRTTFEGNDAALTSILTRWTASISRSRRMASLQRATSDTSSSETFFLTTTGTTPTLVNDSARDDMHGGDGDDWLFRPFGL